jgi:queuine/archaeosine tRNA-ribosyltransferase
MISTFGIPELVLDAVEFGIDIFDGTYPLLMAEDGNALTFYIPGHSVCRMVNTIALILLNLCDN